jgi:hypothetical protein
MVEKNWDINPINHCRKINPALLKRITLMER